jgi:hypothetical protein
MTFWLKIFLSLTSLTLASLSLDPEKCNYVLHNATAVAWATEVCIPWNGASLLDATLYVRYRCGTVVNSTLPTVYGEFHSLHNCTDETSNQVDMRSVTGNNSELVFECGGVDGCHVSYIDACNATHAADDDSEASAAHLIYSPIDTCVPLNDSGRQHSYKMTCDDSGFTYTAYESTLLCDEDRARNTTIITQCAAVNDAKRGNGEFMEFWKCSSRPTSAPTQAPHSSAPTKAPTLRPTKFPTYYNPYYNKSIHDIIDELDGDDDSAADDDRNRRKITFCATALFAVLAVRL